MDGSGDVYTTGLFRGTADFSPDVVAPDLTSAGDNDIFVSKLNGSGNYDWAVRLGGTTNDFGYGIAVDGGGDVYTTGVFTGTADFDPGAGTAQLTSGGIGDIFVSKLDSSGEYVWAKGMEGTGGTSVGEGSGIAVDGSGSVHTTGYFSDTVDFDPGPGTADLTSAGGNDIFVSKLEGMTAAGDGEDREIGDSRTFIVGASGGTFRFGPVKVVIPAGLLSEDSYLVIKELDLEEEGNFKLGDRIFDIKIYAPDGKPITSFNPPLKVCIKPTNAELQSAGGKFASLQLFHRHAGAPWTVVANTYEENGYLCAQISQLSFFTIGVVQLPSTGFAPGKMTTLPKQPEAMAYFDLNDVTASAAWQSPSPTRRLLHSAKFILSLSKGSVRNDNFMLEIPSLDLELPIVGVPLTAQGWNVTWLDDQAGYLEGTAYPTWAGNTAITAHVWDADNNPGPFVDLHTLGYGDQIIIHAWGLQHIYEVREVMQVKPDNLKALPHSDYDMLTLITCMGYDEASGEYDWRIAVQAVLMNVTTEGE